MLVLVTLGCSASSLLRVYFGPEAAHPAMTKLPRRQDNNFI
jgi:hypothetical protein